MSQPVRRFLEFGPFRVDAGERLLYRDGQVVPLTAKTFDILLILIENSGRTLDKEELLREVWPDQFIEEGNLARNVSTLRKALGESPDDHHYIVTIPRRGYRFVAEVREATGNGSHLSATENSGAQTVSPAVESNRQIPAQAVPETGASGALSLFSRIVGHKRMAVSALALLAVVAPGLGWLAERGGEQGRRAVAFQKMKVGKLTQGGNASWPAISPDGKYVAWVAQEVGGQALWLRHLDTGSVQQIFPPAEVRQLNLLSFSPDGNHLYFLKSEKLTPLNALYRMPVLGGVPTRLINEVFSYTLSPDGRQIAFVRNSRSQEESALLIANADGTGERKLATRKLAEPFRFLAWSPDENTIACSAGSAEVSGLRMSLVEVRVADGVERELTAFRWVLLGEVAWLTDGGGLLVCGWRNDPRVSRLWQVSYPGGEVRGLTGDADNYGTFSSAANSHALVATKTEQHSNLWTMPSGDGVANQARQITTGTSNYFAHHWLPDGRLLFTSSLLNPTGQDIWLMNADGTGSQRLTTTGGNDVGSVSGDGRVIVFSSDRAGKLNVWRMDSNGDDLRQLTYGDNDKFPACSPDGKWVVYTAADEWTLWKLPLEGGSAERLTDKPWKGARISPDGKWIASIYLDPQPGAQFKIGLLPFAGGPPARLFAFPPDIQPSQMMQ